MSAFDQRVCEWLNTATIPTSKKQTVLNRVSVSISNYRALEIDTAHPAAAIATAAAAATQQTPRESLPSARSNQKTPLTNRSKAGTLTSTKLTKSRASPTSPSEGLYSPSRASTLGAGVPSLDVDYALQQRIAKALRRLQEGDEGTDENPLFATAPTVTQIAFNDSPSYANDMDGNEVDEQNQPFGAPENETGLYAEGFTFGAPADDNFVAAHDEDGDDQEDGTMTVQEDARRRLTMKRKSRNAISAETVDPEAAMGFTADVVEKDPKHRQRIIESLETHHLFSHLDDDDLAYVADVMTVHTFEAGEHIVSKLDPCDDMLVVVEGDVIVTATTSAEEFEEYGSLHNVNKKVSSIESEPNNKSDSAAASGATSSSSNRNGTHLALGSTIGDLGLMYHSLQPETVDAVTSGTVCCLISRTAYKNICAKASKIKRERYEGFLSKVKFLQGLTKEERLRLADALKSAKYQQGEKIIKYGEEGIWFNIILDGRVDVIGRDESGNSVNVCSFTEGDSVGELEFIFGHKTVADCVAGTSFVKTAKMTANHFEKVIGPAKEVLERKAHDDQVYSYYRQTNKVK
eukprot:GILI01014374.1.p1 GENE.GILI01014374.1~~GILI01014374.1.p1  ORF type:complete len:589 (-),score=172.50 GILI01014374.1:92-1816(-)